MKIEMNTYPKGYATTNHIVVSHTGPLTVERREAIEAAVAAAAVHVFPCGDIVPVYVSEGPSGPTDWGFEVKA